MIKAIRRILGLDKEEVKYNRYDIIVTDKIDKELDEVEIPDFI